MAFSDRLRLPKSLPNRPNAFAAYAVLTVGYILLNLALPPNASTTQAYHLTALEYRQNEWNIFEYNEKDFPQTAIDIPAKVNVLTDEISFYINSLAI